MIDATNPLPGPLKPRAAGTPSFRCDPLSRILGDRPEASVDRSSLEADLDVLLAFAQRIDIIQGFEKQGDGTVLIHIPAFSCALPFREASAFLAQSILDELEVSRPPQR